MSLRVTCPACRQALSVAPEHVGRAVRCPGCQKPFAVRLPAPLTLAMPAPAPVPRVWPLDVAAATSAGRVRSRNEDSFLCLHQSWGGAAGRHEAAVLAVVDGMGGHAAGDRASALGTAALAKNLAPRLAGLLEEDVNADTLLEWLDLALWEAHRAIQREGGNSGKNAMGATAAAAIIRDDLVAICHVGDCRAYLRHDGTLRQLTRDQTLAMRMVELGTLRENEARRHPSASQVTQALGWQFDIEPSRQSLTVAGGDWLILACDGLHADLGEGELAAAVESGKGKRAGELAEMLVERAGRAGGSDNCTAVAVHVG